MPNLYNFLVGNGTVLTNHHTPLVAHTGTDIHTSLTGVYPDHHGQAVSNSFLFFDPQVELLDENAIAPTLRGHRDTLVPLAQVYKQINAPVAQLAMDGVKLSTRALESGTSTDDSLYTKLDAQIAAITSRRNAIAAEIADQLEGVAFDRRTLDEPLARDLIRQAQTLLAQAAALAM